MLQLSAEDAAAVLLVQEAEEAGLRLPVPPLSGDLDDAGDATLLVAQARARIDADPHLARIHGRRAWLTAARPGLWLALPAALAGLFTTSLASDGLLNILTPPLLGLVAWQLVIYLSLVLRTLPGLRGAARAPLRGLRRTLASLAARAAGLGLRLGRDRGAATLQTLPLTFARRFATAAPTLVGARLALALHAAAAAWAGGAIVGLYLDGLGVAYSAYWESTFLGPDWVAATLSVLLAPAALLTGIALPDAEGLARMASTPVPAAPWIHLWATTLALTAVLPRLGLAGLALLRSRRTTLSFDPRTPWLQRTLAGLRGHALRVRLQPMGYRPETASLEQLQRRLQTTFGARIDLQRNDPLPWGADAQAVTIGDAERLVLLLNPAQTPEDDVHGPLLAQLGSRVPVTVALDGAAYRTSPEQRASRIAGWHQLLEQSNTDSLTLDAA
ncbi:MAG: hypothetical protein V2I63_06695 [Pseudomonadales bacterium]|jgi:hypothetical protein|nr:hypothetical protein [Pseudomonadales bacterium]